MFINATQKKTEYRLREIIKINKLVFDFKILEHVFTFFYIALYSAVKLLF